MSEPTVNRAVGRRTFVLGTAAAAGTAALAGPLAQAASAASFGYRDDGSNYVVDTGASLVFKAVSYTHLTLPTNREV